jgi:hypothetical protein
MIDHSPTERSLVTENLEAVAESQNSNSSATIFGWEGEGVWVLQLEEGDAWVSAAPRPMISIPLNFARLTYF